MDVRVWKWGNSWEKRPYMLCTLLYLCILLRNHATASEAAYNQEHKNEVPDPSKLDSLSNYFPYNSREDPDYKRASSFFPLRGKKLSDDDLVRAHQIFISDQDDSVDKRSQFFPLRGKKVSDDLKRASYFMPMRGRKDDGWTEVDYDINDEGVNKRASSFMPMRGKKKYAAISDYLQTKAGTYSNDVSEVVNPSSSHSSPTADKRMHSFVLVRGKRSYKEPEPPNSNNSSINSSDDEEILNHLASKRSISFMPMRGRRESSDLDEITPGEVMTSMLEKKKHSFMPMRGRREDYYDNSDNFDKKASGFMPMRGRRDFSSEESEENSDFEALKRAQSFMPMRGRRTQLRDVVFESSNTPERESKLIEDKRASSFMPMRGRRLFQDTHSNYHEHSEPNNEKRASAFTLMRGRRSIKDSENEISSENSSNPSKRVAFMPMRGRRFVDEDFEVDLWPADQLYSLLDKKSSSFMPMRGRRYVDEDFTVAPWPADQLYSILNKKASSFMPMRGRSYQDEDSTVAPWPADQLYSILNKKSSSVMPMRDRNYQDEDSTVAPWPADQLYGRSYDDETFTVAPWPIEQLMPLLDKKSAFMPMRGSRTSIDNNDHDDYDSDLYNEHKRSSSFMPMRGRSLNGGERNFYNPYPYLMAGIGSSLMSKPYSDQGVSYSSVRSAAERKKKLRINWDAVKRAFHATRGKRFQEIGAFVHSQKDNYTIEPRLSQEEIIHSGKDSDAQTRTKRSISRPSFALQPNRQYIGIF